MNETLKNNRICPQPQHWNKLWEIIKSKTDEKISLPLILAAWWETSDDEKSERFKYHLKIAERLNAMNEVEMYIQSMNENDWHYKNG